MSVQQQDFDQLILKLKARERAGWRSSLLWTIVPALLAFAFLGYASLRLADANREVSALQEQADGHRVEVERLQDEAASLRQQADKARAETERMQATVAESTVMIKAMQFEISSLRKQLQETLNLSKFEHPVDMVDLKMFSSRHREAGKMLKKILQLQRKKVDWYLHGEAPEKGFDSPGFAAYVLQKFDKLPREEGESLLIASRKLIERLEPTTDPKVGDLAIYPADYHLFLFEDKNRKTYVIGMTPSGIVALKPDFAKVIRYRKVR